ncbi:MAG: MOSC domain-containing protein [Bacteroidota bacterium]|nr:MOSC domain-containing protein [Bacteroidota bacterium]
MIDTGIAPPHGMPLSSVFSLQLCPGHRKPMLFVASAAVIAGKGLDGDTHAIEESSRQILLIGKETLDELHLNPGDVKENITTRNISLMRLQFKQQLLIGDSVVLEITKPCSPCSRMDEIRNGLRQQLAGKRGMLARVINGGTIKTGDRIFVQ